MDIYKWANDLALEILEDEDSYNLSRFITGLPGNKYQKYEATLSECLKDKDFYNWTDNHPFYGRKWKNADHRRLDVATYSNGTFSMVFTIFIDISDEERKELIEKTKNWIEKLKKENKPLEVTV